MGALILTVGLLLSGCSIKTLSADEVIQRFTQASSDLQSFHYDATLNLTGNLPSALGGRITSAQLHLTGDVINEDPATPQFSLQADVQATSDQGNIKLTGQLIGLSDYTYFKLTDLDLPTLLPISLGADSRWYRIKQPSLDSDGNKLGTLPTSGGLTSEQSLMIHDVIADSTLLEATQTFPDETAFGQRSYHYQGKLQGDNLRSLLTRISQITGSPVPTGLDSLTTDTADVWINKRTFQLARIKVTDIYLIEGVPISFMLDFGLTSQNERIKVNPPSVAEELDRQNLLDKLAHWQPTM